MGDFNVNISEPRLTSFSTLFKLKNLVKEPTCYINPDNPSCIYPFLTKCASFQNTCAFEPGLSDFYKLISHFEEAKNEASFSFTCVTVNYISKEIKRLEIEKAIQENDIPTKIIKLFWNFIVDFLHKNINSSLTGDFLP